MIVDRDCSTTINPTAGRLTGYLRGGSSSGPAFLSPTADLGFSADALDPLFDSGILREPFPNRAEFTSSEFQNALLDQVPWSKKRHFCEDVGEGGLFGALLFIFNEYACRQFKKTRLPVSREQNNRLPPITK